MVNRPEFKVDADLYQALEKALHRPLTAAEPVIILATYVHWLAKEYGLSDSQHLDPSELERGELPEPAVSLIQHYLVDPSDQEGTRDRLYSIFVDLSEDRDARRELNKNSLLSDVQFLEAAQILWNIEATNTRPLLPIQSGQEIETVRGRQPADIKVRDDDKDYATMKWTQRTNLGGVGLGSNQSFRTKGARLAVLVAQRLISNAEDPPPSVAEATLARPDPVKKSASIVWPGESSRATAPPGVEPDSELGRGTSSVPTTSEAGTKGNTSGPRTGRVQVGLPADVGSNYQWRSQDAEIERIWSETGDRRVWLRGGPGLGKSYTARRVMQQAIAERDDGEDLLIWVDAAAPQAVRHAFSRAVDQMPHLGISVPLQTSGREEKQARALLEVLARSSWRWLVVLDNADAEALIEDGLIPSGQNPNGRVLITTLDRDHRMTTHGRVIEVATMTQDEAKAFVRAQRDPATGRPAAVVNTSSADIAALTDAMGHHPLALSIATSTIVANSLEVRDWIDHFEAAEAMDATADAHDAGGYPHLIGATWRSVLTRASSGLPDGLVERAALVAAIQDPDGHPTWLWECEEVLKWVSRGSSLTRHHGRPLALSRLIDHGILELRGTWRHGRLAIHQLAARAVRELADGADLAALAAVVANQWLQRLTVDEAETTSSLRRNIERFASVPNIPESAKHTITALLAYATTADASEHDWHTENTEAAALYLAKGGHTGQELRAHHRAVQGDNAAKLGRHDEARIARRDAARIYQELALRTALATKDRAGYLYNLGKVHQSLGHIDQAREAFTQTQDLYGRIPDLDPDGLNYLAEQTHIYELLDNQDALSAVLDRATRAVDATADEELASQMRDILLRRHWGGVADIFRRHARPDHAVRILTFMAEALEAAGDDVQRSNTLRKLARIHAEGGRWDDAKVVLERILTPEHDEPDDLVLLASIQRHRGRMANAEETIARAAEAYQSREQGRTVPKDAERPSRGMVTHAVLKLALGTAKRKQRWDDADGISEALIDFHEKQVARDPGERKTERDLAEARLEAGAAKFLSGHPGEAVDPLRMAVNGFQVLADLDPADQETQHSLTWALTFLSSALHRSDMQGEARGRFARAVDVVSEMPDPGPEDSRGQEELAELLSLLAHLGTVLDELEHAHDLYVRLVRVCFMMLEFSPTSVLAESKTASAELALGRTFLQREDFESAETWQTFAVERRQRMVDLDPGDGDVQGELAEALTELGQTLVRLERVDLAEIAFTRAADARRAILESSPESTDAQQNLGVGLLVLGMLHEERGNFDLAADHLIRGTNLLQLVLELNPGRPRPAVVDPLVVALTNLAEILRTLGRLKEAAAAATRAESLTRRYPEPDPDVGD